MQALRGLKRLNISFDRGIPNRHPAVMRQTESSGRADSKA
jgi:hypothetical protein